MKAIQVRAPGGIENLQLVNINDPGAPGKGEIRVRIHASSLNYHDLGVASGAMPTADGRILMADGAGIVEAVGDDVSEFNIGDRVVSTFFPQWKNGNVPESASHFAHVPGDGTDGFACEVVVRTVNAFTHAPKGFSHTQAATLTTAGVTAWRALFVNGDLKAGESVLVLGTGGVSIFAAQLAKAVGATVIATSSSDQKLERAKGLGVDHVINYRKEENWGQRVRELTGGIGVDHVIEVGGPATLPQSIQACRVGGHIALIGVLTGAAGPIPTATFMTRQQRIQGLVVGSRQHQQALVCALDNLQITPVIDQVFPLERIADAFLEQQAGHHFGKIGLEF